MERVKGQPRRGTLLTAKKNSHNPSSDLKGKSLTHLLNDGWWDPGELPPPSRLRHYFSENSALSEMARRRRGIETAEFPKEAR
jgi:hypothetical protein